jgi:DNA replication and repair protein RecF
MALGRVQVTDFRCLQAAEFELDPKFTLITGANASGKTSLLEALYLLGRGRSFRTRQMNHLIRRGASRFVVFGEIESSGGRIGMGVEGSANGMRAQVSGSPPASLAELALMLPVQIIDPEVHRLIEEGPNRRRRFLDWGVFHVKQSFVADWQRYNQILKQRNAALKSGQERQSLLGWDRELIRFGMLITQARAAYVEVLSKEVARIAGRLLDADIDLGYRYGWSKENSFDDALTRSWDRDRLAGVTHVGPHRADLAIRVNGIPAKDHVSRGQQKLLAAALLMAQINLFPRESALQPTLLLDDPAAELDESRLGALISEVTGHALQLVVTTLQSEFNVFGKPGRRYRIADGVLDANVPRGT